MLHLFGFPPSDTDLLGQALDLISRGDAVIFLDQGLALLETDGFLDRLTDCSCHVWADDAPPVAGAQPIDADGFVALSEQHPTSLSWYPEAR